MKRLILVLTFIFFLISITKLFSAFFKLPDTGQTKCYNKSIEISCPRLGEAFYGQDGNYTINSPRFEVKNIKGDIVITDYNTHLMWMPNTADVNNDGKITGDDRVTWEQAVNYCNNLIYGGYSDWRLPTLFELNTIVNYNTFQPAIYGQFNAVPYNYWTTTECSSDINGGWCIDFGIGDDDCFNKSGSFYIRCVRSDFNNNLKQEERFENVNINGDEVVNDKLTNLMWQKSDDGVMRTWKDALEYCENLTFAGYNDWRLPNILELKSIVDYTVHSPAINSKVFDCKPFFYWSSTTWSGDPNHAWVIHFDSGNDYYNTGKGLTNAVVGNYYVRCVRSGLFNFNNACINGYLEYCTDEDNCTKAGGYWYNNKCISKINFELNSGWNLKALPIDKVFKINELFNNNSVISIWKWSNNYWEVWSPQGTIYNLIIKNGLNLIDFLKPGEGFWIKSNNNFKIKIEQINEYGLEKLNIKNGWNLVGIGKNIQINEFKKLNIKTLWKWNGNNWEIWSPIDKIMQIIQNYGLTSFDKIEKGEGFWINK